LNKFSYDRVILRDFSPEGSRAERPIAGPTFIPASRKMLRKPHMTPSIWPEQLMQQIRSARMQYKQIASAVRDST
jgi:hypothetical protein